MRLFPRFTMGQLIDERGLPVTIHEKIHAYYCGMADAHHRYRSWEHCFQYFHRSTPQAIAVNRDQAALQLGFYLASWGMYRGSSFLLQHAYTAHLSAIDQVVSPFCALWEPEFGAREEDLNLVPIIHSAIEGVRGSYEPFGSATDTLVTKVMLGTFGCLPACDRFFIDGFKIAGFSYSYLNSKFVERVLQFCRDNLPELREEQERIERIGGIRYPLMKLVDMYFWQIGSERGGTAIASGTESPPTSC
jgi:hypothetical protein